MHYEMTQSALKVLDTVTGHSSFCSVTKHEHHLVQSIADGLQSWVSCPDTELQTLAVKVMSNLSLVQSDRDAVAEL